MSNRKFKYSFLFLLTSLFLAPYHASAQFMNIQIEIEPEVDAVVEQDLNFGRLITNTGRVQINLGDTNMGVFSIRAVRTQRLLLTLDAPDYLRHRDLNAEIPIELQLAYTNFGVNDYRQAIHAESAPAEIVIIPPPNRPDSEWSLAYIYVFGWIEIGNVPEGVYIADVVLNVEYE